MKANELMIGDWVYDRRDDLALKEINPMRVTGIVKNGAFCQFGNDSYTITVSIGYIAPILLSAEILEKNGFEFHEEETKLDTYTLLVKHHVDGYGFEIVDDYVSISPIDGSWCMEYNIEDDSGCLSLWNVHELQHALRLCGIEKEIEL